MNSAEVVEFLTVKGIHPDIVAWCSQEGVTGLDLTNELDAVLEQVKADLPMLKGLQLTRLSAVVKRAAGGK